MVKEAKDIDHRYQYVRDYIYEATQSRDSLKQKIERVILNYKKRPFINTYKANAERFYKIYAADPTNDRVICNYMKRACDSIPEATNSTIFNAIETVTSMAQGGIGQFEYQPADETLSKDPELADEQAAFLRYIYESNHLDELSPRVIRKGCMQGQMNAMIKYIPDGDNNGLNFKISLVDAYRMVEDPRANKTNQPRYIGYQKVTSWSDIKNDMKVIEDGGEYFVSIVNDVDMYMDEIRNWGESPTGSEKWSSEISEDLNTFASIYALPLRKGSKSVNKKGDKTENPATNPGYKGEDVEVTYLWDLVSDIYFVVINRRFIIYKKDKPLQKKIKIKVPYRDPKTKQLKSKEVAYTVKIDSPLVHRGYIDADWESYPISPVFYCLDDFDNICSKESVLEHDFSIMAPITFMSTSYDAEKVSGLSQIAGQIVEGTQNTLQVMNKTYDLSAITASIQRSEDRIKRMMGATDQFELMALLNNRATGAEVSMANGAVSQRMNILLAQVESFYAELMIKMLKMAIIFNTDDDPVFVFPYKDGVGALTQEDVVGNSLVRVKLASRIKVEQQEQSQNALMVLQTLVPLAEQGVDVKRVIASLVPIITQGVVNRRVADSFVSDDIKIDPAQLNAALNREERRRRNRQVNGPIDADFMANGTPEQMSDLENMTMQTLGGVTPGDISAASPASVTPSMDTTGMDMSADMSALMTPSASSTGEMDLSSLMSGSGSGQSATPTMPTPTGADQMTPIPSGMSPSMAGQVSNQNQNLGVM